MVSTSLLWSLPALHSGGVQIYMLANTHTIKVFVCAPVETRKGCKIPWNLSSRHWSYVGDGVSGARD